MPLIAFMNLEFHNRESKERAAEAFISSRKFADTD